MLKNRSLKFTILLICSFVGRPIAAVWADVNPYFLPQNKTTINLKLSEFLDSAKSEVWVASYYITNQAFVNKLIELKKRNVKVQVIFDKASSKRKSLINQFVNGGIFPVVAYYEEEKIMHNKFIVVDESKVWTGSANFTNRSFELDKNNENVVIISGAPVIAQQYKANFLAIEQEIFQLYADVLQDKVEKSPTVYFELFQLASDLYRRNTRFNASLRARLNLQELKLFLQSSEFRPEREEDSPEGEEGLYIEGTAMPSQGRRPPAPATQKQKAMLLKKGINPEGMSSREAFFEIKRVIQQEQQQSGQFSHGPARQKRKLEERAQELSPQRMQPVSQKQRIILQQGGYSDREVTNMSQEQARQEVGRILRQKQQPPAQFGYSPASQGSSEYESASDSEEYESASGSSESESASETELTPASSAQRTILFQKGFAHRDIDRMSYDQAYKLIGQTQRPQQYQQRGQKRRRY